MEQMQLHARVASDGFLHLDVPFEREDAGADVLVTIEPVKSPATSAGTSWSSFLSETFGTGDTSDRKDG